MRERAQALEAALRKLSAAAIATASQITAEGDHRWHLVDLVTATVAAEKVLGEAPAEGVNPQPPSPAGSPTTEDDRALIAACSPYLKDGETPAQCIARNRADIDSVLTLLAQAKQTVQHLATCATNGHIYGHTGACIFCGEPKFSPVEPTPEPPTCGARHQMTGIVCELPRGHAENHRGEDSHCSSQWPKDEPKAHRAPAPCVWRLDADLDEDLNQRGKPSCQPAKYDSEVYSPFFTTCHYCGHPLTVER